MSNLKCEKYWLPWLAMLEIDLIIERQVPPLLRTPHEDTEDEDHKGRDSAYRERNDALHVWRVESHNDNGERAKDVEEKEQKGVEIGLYRA